MKGITKKDIPVLVLCLSAVVMVMVYSFVYNNGKEKIDQLKSQNEIMRAEVAELKEKAVNLEFYEEETARMKEEIDAIYSYFPADVLIEDGIVSALELEEGAPMLGSGIGFTPAVDIYTVGQGGEATDTTGAIEEAQGNAGNDTAETELEEDVATARNGNATYYSDGGEVHFATAQLPSGYVGEYGPITLRDSIFTYNFETSYSGFKNMVDYFTYLPTRSTIADVNLGYDPNSGLLNGSATINRYSLTGTGSVYEEPSIAGVATGKQNIFGSLELPGGSGFASVSVNEAPEGEENGEEASEQ